MHKKTLIKEVKWKNKLIHVVITAAQRPASGRSLRQEQQVGGAYVARLDFIVV